MSFIFFFQFMSMLASMWGLTKLNNFTPKVVNSSWEKTPSFYLFWRLNSNFIWSKSKTICKQSIGDYPVFFLLLNILDVYSNKTTWMKKLNSPHRQQPALKVFWCCQICWRDFCKNAAASKTCKGQGVSTPLLSSAQICHQAETNPTDICPLPLYTQRGVSFSTHYRSLF